MTDENQYKTPDPRYDSQWWQTSTFGWIPPVVTNWSIVGKNFWWASILSRIQDYKDFKERTKKAKAVEMEHMAAADTNNLYAESLNATDPALKKEYDKTSRKNLLGEMILGYYQENWVHDWDNYQMVDVLDWYMNANPQRFDQLKEFVNSDQDPTEFWIEMGRISQGEAKKASNEKNTLMDKAKGGVFWPLARAVDWLAKGVYWVWKGIANIPNRMWEFEDWQQEEWYVDEEGNNLDTSAYDKLKWWAKLISTVGDMFWDVVWGWFAGAIKGTSTAEERNSALDIFKSIANSEPVEKVQEMYNSLWDAAKKEVSDWLGIADGLANIPLSMLGVWAVKQVGTQWLKAVESETLKQATKQADELIGAGKTALKDFEAKNAAKNLTKNTNEAKDTAGRIIQWDIGSQSEAVNALKQVDTKGVKTYKDLSSKIGTRKTTIAKQVDEILGKETKTYNGTTSKKVDMPDGSYRTLWQTPIQDWIDDLKALYEKLGDQENLLKMKYWEDKLMWEGLTVKEMNDLAKLHWMEFRNKAFNKDWSPKFSDIGVKFEENRKNMKEYVRDLLPDDTTKNLDRAYHELVDTQYYVDKMAESVNKLTQKLKNKSLFEKIWWWIGGIVNSLTGGWIKSFVSKFLPSGAAGNAFNNALDMEKELPKLLNRLDDLNRKIDLAQTKKEAEEVVKIIEDTFQ